MFFLKGRGDFMPQLNKGGKFVFGISVIGNHNVIQIPEQALLEYGVEKEGRYR